MIERDSHLVNVRRGAAVGHLVEAVVRRASRRYRHAVKVNVRRLRQHIDQTYAQQIARLDTQRGRSKRAIEQADWHLPIAHDVNAQCRDERDVQNTTDTRYADWALKDRIVCGNGLPLDICFSYFWNRQNNSQRG